MGEFFGKSRDPSISNRSEDKNYTPEMEKRDSEFYNSIMTKLNIPENEQKKIQDDIHIFNTFIRGKSSAILYIPGIISDKIIDVVMKPPLQNAGKIKKQNNLVASKKKLTINGRSRTVYIGPRGGTYFKKDGKYVRIQK